jgi:hypothetical protein
VQQKETGWVTWCKANPRNTDKGEQVFLEHIRRIFTGKYKELKRNSDSRVETSGGMHVTKTRRVETERCLHSLPN